MSVKAARIFIACCAFVLVGCVVWFGVAWFRAADSGSQLADVLYPATFGFIAAVAIAIALPLFVRHGEVEILMAERAGAPTQFSLHLAMRTIFGRRTIELSDIADAVLLKKLFLPARRGPAAAERLYVRMRDGSTVSITPRRTEIEQQLAKHGVSVAVDFDVLTVRRAMHRYPGSVSGAERFMGMLPWIAVAIGVAVIIWAVWFAVAR